MSSFDKVIDDKKKTKCFTSDKRFEYVVNIIIILSTFYAPGHSVVLYKDNRVSKSIECA